MIADSSMIIYANLEQRCSNILISINTSVVIFYALGGFTRCSTKDENDSHGTEFDFRVKMEFLSRLMSPSSSRLRRQPIFSTNYLSPL